MCRLPIIMLCAFLFISCEATEKRNTWSTFYNGTNVESFTVTDLGSKTFTSGFKYVFKEDGNLYIEKDDDFTKVAGIDMFNIPDEYIISKGVTCNDVRLSDSDTYLEMSLELGETTTYAQSRGIRGKSPTLYLSKGEYDIYTKFTKKQ